MKLLALEKYLIQGVWINLEINLLGLFHIYQSIKWVILKIMAHQRWVFIKIQKSKVKFYS